MDVTKLKIEDHQHCIWFSCPIFETDFSQNTVYVEQVHMEQEFNMFVTVIEHAFEPNIQVFSCYLHARVINLECAQFCVGKNADFISNVIFFTDNTKTSQKIQKKMKQLEKMSIFIKVSFPAETISFFLNTAMLGNIASIEPAIHEEQRSYFS